MPIDQFIQTVIGGIAIGSVYSLIALGISMIVRATDILHFAQGELVMIGCMAGLSAYWLNSMPFAFVLVFGMLGGAAAATLIEVCAYRPLRARNVPLINIVIATLGISMILQNGARLVWGSEPLPYPTMFASSGISLGSTVISPQFVWILVLSLAMMGGLILFFRFTRTGLAMQAAAQDADAAQLMGISVERTTTATFALAGLMAGAAGVLLGSLFFASFNMGFVSGIKAFVAATLGGLGSIAGAIVGGILFGLIETFAGMVISTAYKDAIGMVVLIGILLLAPNGLFGRAGRQV